MPRKRSQDNSSRNLLLISAMLVAVVLMVAITATYFQARELAEHRKAVIWTQHLITLLTRLESAMYKVESQQRGYLISGKKKYLSPYKKSKESLYEVFNSIEALLQNNNEQLTHLNDMKSHIDKKLTELESTIELRRRGHYKEARDIVLTDQGQNEMEAFILSMRTLKREENRILRIQSRQLESAASEALNRLITLSFLSLVAFAGGFIYIKRVDASRRKNRLTQQVLFEVSYIMAKTEDLSTSIAGILEAICEQFNWQVGVFWRESQKEKILKCNGFFSRTSLTALEDLVKSTEIKKDEGLTGKVWRSESPRWSRNVAEDKSSPLIDQIKNAGLHSAFAIPINSGESFTGIFEFFSNQIEKPDNELMEAFSLVGAEIGQLVERREIEDKLQKSLHELAQAKGVMDSVLDNMSSGVIYVDKSGEMSIFNKSVERILGKGSRDKKLEDWEDKIFWADKATPVKYEQFPIIRALNGEETNNVEIRVINDDTDNGIILNVNGRPVKGDNGKIIGGVIVVDDITVRHEAEKRVSEFYSMVSHELRTPLTSIKGSLGLLEGGKAGQLSPRAKSLVSMGREECDRLVRLINDILDIRKIEAGKLEIKRVPLDSAKIVDEVIESMSAYAQENNVRLIASKNCSEPISADRDRIAQILNNLISNAVKFSPEEGTVTVSTALKPDVVRFEISDQGPGISEQDQQKLFKIFQQLNSTDSRPKGGTGLGLAICKALVEQHEGSIGLESQPGEGSNFWFEIARHFSKE